MKELLWIACALLALEWIEDATRDAHPLMIDAAAPVDNRFCDVPAYRGPLLRGPAHKVDYRIGRPFNDKGIS
jgi:hypothetical protein